MNISTRSSTRGHRLIKHVNVGSKEKDDVDAEVNVGSQHDATNVAAIADRLAVLETKMSFFFSCFDKGAFLEKKNKDLNSDGNPELEEAPNDAGDSPDGSSNLDESGSNSDGGGENLSQKKNQSDEVSAAQDVLNNLDAWRKQYPKLPVECEKIVYETLGSAASHPCYH
jgi:hypothetical protein